MLERLNGLPEGVEGVKAVGKVSKDDYERVYEPMLEDARRSGRRLRLLYQFGPEFQGFTPSGAWEDAKVGLRSFDAFDGCAIVTDITWIGEAARLFRFMMPCPVRSFSNRELEQAGQWLSSLRRESKISHRVLGDRGVIVVEIEQALRAPDFEELARTADEWIESHGDLQGLVIHARQFPGWENLGSFIQHVRFVRDHHRKIRRLALAVDAKRANLAPRSAEHFVKAELRSFGYGALDDAIAWAAGNDRAASQPAPTPSA